MSKIKRADIQLIEWQPSPGMPDGAIVFNNSRTNTKYQRFSAVYDGYDVIVMLNNNMIFAYAGTPVLLEGKVISIPELDLEIALSKQRITTETIVLAITNFSLPAHPEFTKLHQDIYKEVAAACLAIKMQMFEHSTVISRIRLRKKKS